MKSDIKKPLCYSCKWRRDLPGDDVFDQDGNGVIWGQPNVEDPLNQNSSCHHPSIKAIVENPYGQMFATLAAAKRTGFPFGADHQTMAKFLCKDPIEVKAHPHGIKMGWFLHPWNFDPRWLEECTGYENKI